MTCPNGYDRYPPGLSTHRIRQSCGCEACRAWLASSPPPPLPEARPAAFDRDELRRRVRRPTQPPDP